MNGHFNLGDVDASTYFFASASILGLLFAFITPDNVAMDTTILFIVWQLQTLLPIALVILSHIALTGLQLLRNRNPWINLFFSGCLGAFLFAPIALGIDLLIVGEETPKNLLLEFVDELSAVVPPVVITWLILNAPWVLGFSIVKNDLLSKKTIDTTNDSVITEDLNKVDGTHEFLQTLSRELGTNIIYLEAQLHYLNVVTTKGSELILYNLKDAVQALAVEGFQCHRSYWVALKHVKSLRKTGRTGQIIVTGDISIPVSRRMYAQVAGRLSGDIVKKQ